MRLFRRAQQPHLVTIDSSARPRLGGDLGSFEARGDSSGAGLVQAAPAGLAVDVADARSSDPDQEGSSYPEAASTTAASSLMSRGIVYLLVAAIGCGPVAVVMLATRHDPTPVAVAAGESPDLSARRAAAQEVASQWTRAWLSTPASAVNSLKVYWSGPLTLPETASRVTDSSIGDAIAVAPGVWTISMAMDVTPPGGSSQRRYFQVPVAVSGGAGTAQAQPMTVPAEISGPGRSVATGMAYSATVSTSGAAATAVHGFLTAFVAGSGDLTRWSSPQLTLAPVTPAPYGDVQVAQLLASEDVPGLSTGQPTDGAVAHLLATVMMRLIPAVDGQADTFRTGQYLLTLTARAGRWEVSALDAGPAVTSAPAAASSTR